MNMETVTMQLIVNSGDDRSRAMEAMIPVSSPDEALAIAYGIK
jgi:cellobiose-specific phosphotransferase system component IIA